MKPNTLISGKTYIYVTVLAYLAVATALTTMVPLNVALLGPTIILLISIISFLLP